MQRLNAWLDQDERRSLLLSLLALAALCGLAYGQQLGSLGLMDKTEGLFVEIPREMLTTGDWITPRWNGELFFDYPVWGYWMVALSFRMFGVSEWAARLPVALAASATVFALFATLMLVAPAKELPHLRVGRALLGSTVLALSPGWLGWGRSSVTDMFLASGISLALLGFVLAHFAREERPWQRPLGYVALAVFCGIAVLAKGPVGLLLPGLVMLVFWVLNGTVLEQLRTRFRVRQVYVKAPFVDFARSPASPMVVAHVTRNQFVKALARHEVMLAPEQFALLAKKYDDLGDGSINYEAFCEAVDSYKSATGVKLYSGFKKERYILG